MKINQTMSAFLHIMVNYRNDAETEAFLLSCLKLAGADQGLFVIVNNSASSLQDEVFHSLQSSYPEHVRILNCPDNPGYFPGAQRALSTYANDSSKYVIVSNTDLEILNKNFYELLLKLPANSQVGSIAPSIKSGLSQKECTPLYWSRPSREKMHFLKWIYSHFFVAWLYHLLSFLKSRFGSPQRILSGQTAYAPNGCFLILTKNYFESGGDFSHAVRLYGEEIVLAETLRRLGLTLTLEPALKIFHREKGTESSLWNRVTLSRRTFEFKKEAARHLESCFE